MLPWFHPANRDPAVFDAPNRFDITRSPNRHIAFGSGPHMCISKHLARAELQIALEQCLDRVEAFERIDPAPLELTGNRISAIVHKSFRLRVTRRAGGFRPDALPLRPHCR